MLQLITIQLGEFNIAFDLKKVVKVIAAQSIIDLSYKSDFVIGLLDFYGEIIAVVDMYKRLNIKNSDQIELTDKFIIVETGKRKIAFKADDVLDLKSVDTESIVNSKQLFAGAQFISVVKNDEKMIYVYDTEVLLSYNELIEIESYIQEYNSNNAV